MASLVAKESACKAGDPGSIPESGRSPGEGNGNLLQYPWLENSMNRGAWWVIVHSPWGSQRVGHDRVTDTLVHSIPFTCSLPRNNF